MRRPVEASSKFEEGQTDHRTMKLFVLKQYVEVLELEAVVTLFVRTEHLLAGLDWDAACLDKHASQLGDSIGCNECSLSWGNNTNKNKIEIKIWVGDDA